MNVYDTVNKLAQEKASNSNIVEENEIAHE